MANNNPENEICILCDFVNEPTIDVGYAEWLIPNLSNEQIEEVIRKKSEVIIYWPSCDTAPPSVMKKRLKEVNCTWKRQATKIIAQGGWIEMCEQLKYHINYSITESTKSGKKKLKRKYLTSDDSDETHNAPTKISRRAYRKRKTERALLKESSILGNSIRKKRESCIQLVNDSSSSDEDDEDLQRYSIKDLMSTIETLREENKRLRADNARLHALNGVNDDLPEMKKLSAEILRNLRATSKLVGLYSSAESQNNEQDDTSEKKDDSSTSLTVNSTTARKNKANFPEQMPSDMAENTSSKLSHNTCKELETRYIKTEVPMFDGSSNGFDDQSSANENCSRMSPTPSFQDGLRPVPVLSQEFLPLQETVPGHPYYLQDNENLTEGFVDLGAGCLVDALQLSKCSRKNATKMTCDLLSLVFTREELANSSLTGKVPNTLKKTGTTAKKKLDPVKVAAISAFIMKEFTAPSTKGEIFTAIKNKCNNTAKALRKEHEKSINVVLQ